MKTMNNFIMSAVAGLILINTEAKADLLQCKPCPDGYICDGKKKEACPAGTYQTYKTSANKPKDSYCRQCSWFEYSSEGSAKCTACPKYYFAEDNKTCKLCPKYSSDKDFGFFFIAQCSVGKSYESGDKLYWTLNFYHPNNTAKYNLKFYNMDVYDSHDLNDIIKNACKSGDYIYTLSPLQAIQENDVYQNYPVSTNSLGKTYILKTLYYQTVQFPKGVFYNYEIPCSIGIYGRTNPANNGYYKYLWHRSDAWVSLFASYPTLQDFKNLSQDFSYFPQHDNLTFNDKWTNASMRSSNYSNSTISNTVYRGYVTLSKKTSVDFIETDDIDYYIYNYDYWEDDDD